MWAGSLDSSARSKLVGNIVGNELSTIVVILLKSASCECFYRDAVAACVNRSIDYASGYFTIVCLPTPMDTRLGRCLNTGISSVNGAQSGWSMPSV